MTLDSDRVLDTAEGVLRRVDRSNRARVARRRSRRRARMRVAARRLAFVTALIAALMIAIGVVHPIGIDGAMLFALVALVGWAVVLFASAEPEARVADLAVADLPRLPARTERWLEAQRPALPAPAITLVDTIELRLDTLSPQLATLDPQGADAAELRKLIGEELPELVEGYRRVPPALRATPNPAGLHPDRQLLDGLAVVDEQLARITQRIADTDLHRLATQGRFLELKYRGDTPPSP